MVAVALIGEDRPHDLVIRLGTSLLSQLMQALIHLTQPPDSIFELFCRPVTAVEVTGDGVDLSACLVHKGNGLPCLRLPEQDGAVGFHLPHQPCAGGQSGGPVPFLQQIVFLCAHADTGAVWLAIAKPYFPRYQCCSEMLAGNGFLATLSEVHLSPPKIAFGNIAKPGFLAQTCRQCCQKVPSIGGIGVRGFPLQVAF